MHRIVQTAFDSSIADSFDIDSTTLTLIRTKTIEHESFAARSTHIHIVERMHESR